MSVEVKTGMWRMRNGKTACVVFIVPESWGWDYPAKGFCEGGLEMSWTLGGEFTPNERRPYDLIEHLSDEIADPRTWKPLQRFKPKEGIWIDDEGDEWLVRKIKGKWVALCGRDAYDVDTRSGVVFWICRNLRLVKQTYKLKKL